MHRISSLWRRNTHGILTYNTRMIYVGYTYYYASDILTKPQYPPCLADPKHHTRMAKVIPSLAFDNFSGKLGRKDRIILRTRYGKTHAYTIENPYTGPATEAQNTMRSTFGMAVKQASAILKDPEQKADWERRYTSYRKHYRASSSARYYSTLRGFIIATLNAELKSRK